MTHRSIRRISAVVSKGERESAEQRLRARLSEVGASEVEVTATEYQDGTVELTGLGVINA